MKLSFMSVKIEHRNLVSLYFFTDGILINISIIAAAKKHNPEIYSMGIIPQNPNNIPPITGPIRFASEATRFIEALACIMSLDGTRNGILACTVG